MFFALAYLLLRRLIQLVAGSTQLNSDIELVVLRHQLKVLKRQVSRPRLRRRDRLFMAAISRVLPPARWSSFVVSPLTLLRWHRDLVRRKWTYRGRAVGGRPPIPNEVRALIVRMGRENPRWGASGFGASSPSSASGCRQRRSVRCCGGLDSARLLAEAAPPGASSCGPRAHGIVAVDFFTVETLQLGTLYVLFAIEVSSRRVHILGVTRNPVSKWVTPAGPQPSSGGSGFKAFAP